MKPLHPVGLIYTPLTKKALKIAFDAHRNQLDKSGIPYVVHPLHLAEQMETEEEICTALLHDVVEDSPYTLQNMEKEGFPDAVLQALELLTRQPDVPYLNYVVQLRKNPIARKVKLADLAHNSDLARLDRVTDRDRRRMLRYRMAQAILAEDRCDEARGCCCKRLPLSLEQPAFLTVFYDAEGAVKAYTIDLDQENRRYALDPRQAEELRLALHPGSTLPQALAEWMEVGCSAVRLEKLLRRQGIAF